HIFAFVHPAATRQVTGIDLPLIVFRLFLFPQIVLVVLEVCVAARLISHKAWVGPIAGALILFANEINLNPNADSAFAGSFFLTTAWSSSFLLGIVFFIPA